MGRIGGVGGKEACDGDMVLHFGHDKRWLEISAAMPGQKTQVDCIRVVPWCAE